MTIRQDDQSPWIQLDSVYLDDEARGPQRVARLCQSSRRAPPAEVSRSFAIVRRRARTYDDVSPAGRSAPPGAMRACGRQYSLALLALLDALATEPSRSPLATSAPLDDLRATALLVAGATVAERPDPSLIDQAVRQADRRLVDLHVPLRATGYLAARDALRHLMVPLLEAPPRAGPPGSAC
jgi:hypothetical protein